MSLQISEEKKVPFLFDFHEVIRIAVEGCLDYIQCPFEVEISVTLTGNEEIKEINNEFRGVDSETDVLSFPMIDFVVPGDFDFLEDELGLYFHPDSGELILGDIVLSIDKVIEQADLYGHSYKRELAFLIVHSMFHLFGFDHINDLEMNQMEKMQEKVLLEINIKR